MMRGARREASHITILLRFTQRIAVLEVVEEIYAAALSVVQEIFNPDRGFIALSESPAAPCEVKVLNPGLLHDVSVPICAGDKLLGRIMLQYDVPCPFSDEDVVLLELIAAESGISIHRIHEKSRAHEALQDRQELVAMAAHELRAPLSAIIGGVQLLRGSRENHGIRAIDMIERNAQAQMILIEELLQVSELDAGKVELKIANLDLTAILARVIEDIQSTASANNTALISQIHGPIILQGDARRLWQLFWNLLANSIRFCPNGKLRISAGHDGEKATVSIQDNGVGITKDQLPHIFERFRQGHVPRMKLNSGLGLGLAIVKDLVALHHGTVTAESDGPGTGALFTIILPIVCH